VSEPSRSSVATTCPSPQFRSSYADRRFLRRRQFDRRFPAYSISESSTAESNPDSSNNVLPEESLSHHKLRVGPFYSIGVVPFYVVKTTSSIFTEKPLAHILVQRLITGNFTVYCHVVVYGPYVAQDQLSRDWLKIAGDSCIVDIRKVKGAPRKSLNYLLKYIGKPCGFDEPRDYAIYLAALQGVRRVRDLLQLESSRRERTVCLLYVWGGS
jgi:hypothetical protein